ncbi:hypothetical protein ACFYOV_17765 [Streptomyces sp. NPDC005931]|uniref:hypothetical protein n=1 Tax=Streptomyces sp. NPDC005931 TaxID=3364737 RepID=UPI0036C8CAAB
MDATGVVTVGTHQSGDVLVTLRPAPRLLLRVHSPVADIVGDRLRALGREALSAAGITSAGVDIHDNAASEWVVRARLRTAIRRWHAVAGVTAAHEARTETLRAPEERS